MSQVHSSQAGQQTFRHVQPRIWRLLPYVSPVGILGLAALIAYLARFQLDVPTALFILLLSIVALDMVFVASLMAHDVVIAANGIQVVTNSGLRWAATWSEVGSISILNRGSLAVPSEVIEIRRSDELIGPLLTGSLSSFEALKTEIRSNTKVSNSTPMSTTRKFLMLQWGA